MSQDESTHRDRAASDPLAASDIGFGIPVADRAKATDLYRALLGEPIATGLWAAANGTVTLFDEGESPAVDFVVADLDRSLTLLNRRGLPTVERLPGSFSVDGTGPLGVTARVSSARDAAAIDHVVLTHPDAEAAVALYGGRLGLDLRLVKSLTDDVSQLFFRTRTAIVEVVAGPAMAEQDRFGGIAWRADDIDAERRRLVDAGLNVSEVRSGRKTGTRVCTVRERDLGTPTLIIEQTLRAPGGRRA
ncbi:VOC family protein [Gordonia zhaorongruii]|uniref:VOC family protein n=1 Tax=Gordonia zhaorongruii TaxID=2597659 RepID=UPI0010537414|nr:VOC family protein [Gordonia zhaorongruii]